MATSTIDCEVESGRLSAPARSPRTSYSLQLQSARGGSFPAINLTTVLSHTSTRTKSPRQPVLRKILCEAKTFFFNTSCARSFYGECTVKTVQDGIFAEDRQPPR